MAEPGGQAMQWYVIMETKTSKEYKTPKTKVVEMKATNLICSSPGGNEDPEDFPIG